MSRAMSAQGGTLSPAEERGAPEAVLSGTGATKAVCIAEPETMSPTVKERSKEMDEKGESFDLDRSSPKQHRVPIPRRLSGRPSAERLFSSRQNLTESPIAGLLDGDSNQQSASSLPRHLYEGLIAQVTSWVNNEKARRAGRKSGRKVTTKSSTSEEKLPSKSAAQQDGSARSAPRRPSDASDSSIALNNLQSMIEGFKALLHDGRPTNRTRPTAPRRVSSIRKLRRQSTTGSSDTDFADGEPVVPSCDVILDNSKTLAYAGSTGRSEEDVSSPGKTTLKGKEAWATFKFEIVRLTHTLRLKGWRRVPMERSNEIEVERLSGALTNAVYVVSPPKELPHKNDSDFSLVPRRPPPKLLLRVYGPQVEHLIDREAELEILRRLARKRIGPRLLGTFTNGRFEEFLHARALTPRDLRNPEISQQIAKRMRELHEGIDLLPEERANGAFVWHNWDKWVERCEQIVSWLDTQIVGGRRGSVRSKSEAWKQRGLVCGVEWPLFRQAVEKYRKWLYEQSGGPERVKEKLVFAHNDAQYGNILRLEPAGESPLLLPANEHKQLVVIDFEYANANTPGLEFANHFTEWCYNYHNTTPHALNTKLYPTPEEQYRFIRAYVRHRPNLYPTGATPPPGPQTPNLLGQPSLSSSSSTFMLDSRHGSSASQKEADTAYATQEAAEESAIENRVQQLLTETRLWRLANSAQWVAWGIVQAKVPDMPDFDDATPSKPLSAAVQSAVESLRRLSESQATDPLEPEEEAMAQDLANKRPEEESEDEEFDYLGYAQERAFFFWGDAVRLGIVREEELPKGLLERIEIVPY